MEAFKKPLKTNSNVKTLLSKKSNEIVSQVMEINHQESAVIQNISKNSPDIQNESTALILNEKNDEKLFDYQIQADLDTISNITKFLNESDIKEDLKNNSIKNKKEMICDSMTEIDALPIEIICKIFDYLDFCERKNASLVCKKWRNAFIESYYLRNIVVKANNNLFVSSRPSSASLNRPMDFDNPKTTGLNSSVHRSASSIALSTYSSISTFNFQLYNNLVNLEFINDSADVNLLLKILNNQKKDGLCKLPKLKNLKFEKTALSSKDIIDMFEQAPNLESISLIHCDSLFMSGFLTCSFRDEKFSNLNNLKEINLSKNRYLTDYLLGLFLNSTNELISLDLSYCNLTKTNFKSISKQQLNSSIDNKPSKVVLTLENLIKLIDKLINLKSINLSGIEMFNHDEDSLLNFVEKLPNLTDIYLSNLPNLKVNTVNKLLEKVPNLKLIDLNNSIQFDDFRLSSIESILEKSVNVSRDSISNLKVLKINKSKINDPKFFSEQISFLTRLTYLDLSCMMLKHTFSSVDRLNQFIEEFASNLSKCNNIEHLNMSYCDFMVNDTFINIISKKLKNLKHLDLRNCSLITDKSIHFISNYMTKLVHLDLSWCQNISDYGLDRSCEYNHTKALLNEFNKHLNGSCRCIRRYNEQPFLLLKTKNELKSHIKKQFCSCIGVEYKSVDDEKKPANTEVYNEEDGIKVDVSLKNLKNLKVLKLESCVNISDVGLFNGINLSNLNELDIKLCTNVNGDFVYSNLIEKNNECKRLFNNLKILNLKQCIKFKEENLIYLIENSTNLRDLSIAALPLITNEFIEYLIRFKKLLFSLDVSFCPNLNESCVEKYENFLHHDLGLRDFIIDKRFIKI